MSSRNERGFTHHLALGVVGILVFGMVMFAGSRVYKSKNMIDAKAFTWQELVSSPLTVSVCKSDLGSNWKIMTQIENSSTLRHSYEIKASSSSIATDTKLLWAGAIEQDKKSQVYIKVLAKDSYKFISAGIDGGGSELIAITALRSC